MFRMKKWLNIIISIFLIFTLIPINVFANTSYGFYDVEKDNNHIYEDKNYNSISNNETIPLSDTTEVYFANDISQNENPRYSAVSLRQIGDSKWEYSSYFASLSYEENS